MNVKKCANGHFFDADKYQLCPHCGASTEHSTDTLQQAAHEKRDKHPVRRKKEEATESIIRPMPQKTMGKTFGVFDEPEQPPRSDKSVRVTAGYSPSVKAEDQIGFRPCPKCGKTISAKSRFCKHCGSSLSEEVKAPVDQPVIDKISSVDPVVSDSESPAYDRSETVEVKEETRTCPFCGKGILDEDVFCIYCGKLLAEETEPAFEVNAPAKSNAPSVWEQTSTSETKASYQSASSDTNKDTESVASAPSAAPSLEAAVKSAVSGNDGRTIGFFSMGASNHTPADVDPVVGWLVCVKGKHFGESFPIAAGRNSVGRGTSNKITISDDNSVSREKHTWITYDPKHRVFFIQPGDSSGLSYLNGETVMETKKMAAKDKIEIGDGMYLLIPLCDESFSWEEYIK